MRSRPQFVLEVESNGDSGWVEKAMPRTFIGPLSVGLALFFASVAATQQPTVQAVGNVKQLMRAMVAPSSNALFDVPRQVPKDDAEWAFIENSAVILGESGNLLMIGGRSQQTQVWMETSQALVDAGRFALQAAEARDLDALADVGNRIVDACETCHNRHWDRSGQN